MTDSFSFPFFFLFFFFFFNSDLQLFLISFILPESNKSLCWAVWLFKALLASSQRISIKVPTWLYHSYKSKSLLTFFACGWFTLFFHFGVLFCIIFTYYDNQSYILWKIKTSHRYNIQLFTYSWLLLSLCDLVQFLFHYMLYNDIFLCYFCWFRGQTDSQFPVHHCHCHEHILWSRWCLVSVHHLRYTLM